MKVYLFSALVALAYSGPAIVRDPSAPLFTQEDIDMINQSQDSWTASLDWVGTMTVEQAKGYASNLNQIIPREFPEYNWEVLPENFQAPSSFDSRTQWPNCIHPIRNQQQCLSDWAFASSGAFSDRLCIASNGTVNVALSPQYLVDCDYDDYGCEGAGMYTYIAWMFIMINGIPTDECVPYTGTDDYCPATCGNGSALKFYKVSSVFKPNNKTSIQSTIIAGGPIEAQIDLYDDFFSYQSGIYVHTTGVKEGRLAVKIVGWGFQNGLSYWICANSWGTKWGMNGYFYILFGQCGIESNAAAGIPLV